MSTQTAITGHNDRTHDMLVGERINMLMFRNKMTQTALGRALGMTQSAFGKKLHGERKWSLDELYAVANALDVSVFDLLENNKPDSPNPRPLDYKAERLARIIAFPARSSAGAVAV